MAIGMVEQGEKRLVVYSMTKVKTPSNIGRSRFPALENACQRRVIGDDVFSSGKKVGWEGRQGGRPRSLVSSLRHRWKQPEQKKKVPVEKVGNLFSTPLFFLLSHMSRLLDHGIIVEQGEARHGSQWFALSCNSPSWSRGLYRQRKSWLVRYA